MRNLVLLIEFPMRQLEPLPSLTLTTNEPHQLQISIPFSESSELDTITLKFLEQKEDGTMHFLSRKSLNR